MSWWPRRLCGSRKKTQLGSGILDLGFRVRFGVWSLGFRQVTELSFTSKTKWSLKGLKVHIPYCGFIV